VSQELQAGQIVPESGVYRITHDPMHADPAVALTFIRGRRFPTCPHCDKISFTLVYSDEAYWRHRAAQRAKDRQRRRSRQVRLREIAKILAGILTSIAALGSLIRKKTNSAIRVKPLHQRKNQGEPWREARPGRAQLPK
jgi:hypothetical protein